MPILLLCSGSPRRRELLSGLGLCFEVLAPAVDESPRAGEGAGALAERLAHDKARAGRAAFAAREAKRAGRAGAGTTGPRAAVALAADTVVARADVILGKPRDRAESRRMLALLAGGDHSVFTGVCAVDPAGAQRSCVVETRVRFRPLSEAQLAWLAGSGEGDDKAGAYALQGLAGAFVERVDGSVSGVVGLPLAETLELLAWAGLPLPWTEAAAPG